MTPADRLDQIEAATQQRIALDVRLRDLVADAMDAGVPVAQVARAAGVTRQTAYRWTASAAVPGPTET